MAEKYAIIETGSKQYRVEEGDVIDVELLDGAKDETIEFSNVLLFHDGKEAKLGAPSLPSAVVRGTVMDMVRGPKVIAYKYKKRKNYRLKKGHRQNYMRVKITDFAV